MAFVPVPNVAMVEMFATKDGQRIENRFHVNIGHEPSASDLSAVNDVVGTWQNTDYKDILPTDVVLSGLDATSLHVQNGPVASQTYALPGGIESPSLPNEVTYCVTLRTAVRGRSARGRMYMLGVAENQRLGQNNVTTAYAADAQLAVLNLISVLAAHGTPMVIVSYVSNKAPRPDGPVIFEVVTAVTFDTVLDSMKRRKPGVGT